MFFFLLASLATGQFADNSLINESLLLKELKINFLFNSFYENRR